MSETYNAAENSAKGYELAIKAAREKCIRAGTILPRIGDEQEKRWQREGVKPPSELDSARG